MFDIFKMINNLSSQKQPQPKSVANTPNTSNTLGVKENIEVKLNQPLNQKASRVTKVESWNEFNPDTNLAVYNKAYADSDTIFSIVSYIADITSQIKFEIFKQLKNGKLIDTPYRELKDWLEQPNPFQPMSEIIYTYIISHLINGNAYLTYERVGRHIESWILNPLYVQIVPDEKRYISGFIYKNQIAFKTDEVLFFKNPSLDNMWYGVSYLSPLLDMLKLESFSIEDLKEFYEHSLIAQGIFTSEFPLTQKQIEALKEQFRQLYGMKGSDRYGHIIAPNNLKYQPIKFSPKDAMLLDALKISEERIYKLFRLSPALLGDLSHTSKTGLAESKKIFVNNFIRPLINRLLKTWETFFRRKYKDNSIVFVANYSDIPEISDALTEKVDKVRIAVASGLISPNEGRYLIGFDEIKDSEFMDSIFTPQYLVGQNPIDMRTGKVLNFDTTQGSDKKPNSLDPDGGSPDIVGGKNEKN